MDAFIGRLRYRKAMGVSGLQSHQAHVAADTNRTRL